jgi:hypothetical protein
VCQEFSGWRSSCVLPCKSQNNSWPIFSINNSRSLNIGDRRNIGSFSSYLRLSRSVVSVFCFFGDQIKTFDLLSVQADELVSLLATVLNFHKRLSANLSLPVDSPASEPSDQDTYDGQSNRQAFKNRKWFAFLSIVVGVLGIVFGVYFSYICRANWRDLYVCPWCICAYGICTQATLAVRSLYSTFGDVISLRTVSRKRKGFLRLLKRKHISSR